MAKAKPHNWKKFNEWRFNKKVDINEENESLWTWIYKGMIGGFRKAGKEGGHRECSSSRCKRCAHWRAPPRILLDDVEPLPTTRWSTI